MLSTVFRLKLLKKCGFLHYAFSKSMFRKPIINIILFIIEFCVISYGYVLLHNSLSPADAGISYSKSMYFTVISATTVGYGDHFPIHTISQWYVILLMILYLPFRFFYTAGVTGFLFKTYQDLKIIGRWFPMLYDHVIVYCNAKTIEKNNYLWLKRFVHENRLSLKFKKNDILLVNDNQDANDSIIQFFSGNGDAFKGVRFVNANLNEEGFFEKIRIDHAEQVYVLADEQAASTDSEVFDFVYRIAHETSYTKGITAELVNNSNRERLVKLGVNVILRPNRSMPEMLITCTIAPGSAQMLEEIYSRGGDSIERFSILHEGFTWGELLYQLSMQNVGTATAIIYADADNAQAEFVDPNPKGATIVVNTKGILILIHEMRKKCYTSLQNTINTITAELAAKNNPN